MNDLSKQNGQGSSILIAIVNYRTGGLVVDCLTSLAAEIEANPETRVVVVDNASGDCSCERIAMAIMQRGWSSWAKLVVSPVNGGFADGNNRAIAADMDAGASRDFVWLLNPDTLVRPGAIRILTEFMRAHPHAGIAGTLLDERDGTPWPYAFRFPTMLGEMERGARLGALSRLLRDHVIPLRMGDQPARVDWVSGASMLIRSTVFNEIGPMDSRYFLYYEETDFCLQARKAGWECWYVPGARVLHIAGQSTGLTGSQAVVRRMPPYWFESRRRYFVKNHGRLYAMAADILWMAGHAAWRLRRRLQSLADPDPPKLLKDFLRHSALLHRPMARERNSASSQ